MRKPVPNMVDGVSSQTLNRNICYTRLIYRLSDWKAHSSQAKETLCPLILLF